MKTLIIALSCLFSANVFSQNLSLGDGALKNNTIGKYNTALGYFSLYYNSSGNNNTAVGFNSLYSNQDGINNTAVGVLSLRSNDNGNNNTAVGYSTGLDVITGSNLTLIGYNAEPTSSSAINQITLGDAYVTSLRCAVTTITAISDARDKKNITDLSLGLDFISKLKPRQFNWDRREWYEGNTSDGSKMEESPTAGFIAQELDEIQTTQNAEWLNLVLKDNPEKLEATPGNLLPVMVKAIQELKAENDELKKEVEQLKTVNEKIAKLEQMVNELTSIKHTSLIETEAPNNR